MSRRLSRRKRRAAGVGTQSDPRVFAVRHGFVVLVLLATVPALTAVGMARGVPVYEIVIAALLLITLGGVGIMAKASGLASGAVAMGLVTAAGILVRFLDGSTTSTFAFFLAVVAISIYRERRALIVAVVYVAGYHLFAAIFDFSETLTRTQDETTTVSWPVLHIVLTVILALLLMAGWRVNTKAASRVRRGYDGYRLGFERATLGMGVLTPSGEFVHANRTLTDLLGQEPGHLVGANIRTLVHGYDLDKLGETWEEMADRANERLTTWLRCVTDDGKELWSRLSLTLVTRAGNRPALVVLQLEDADADYHQQQRHDALIRGRDEFVATIAEEMREPIGAILDLTARPAAGHLRQIEAHAGRVATVVDDLIVSARGGAGSKLGRTVDVGRLCDDVLMGIPGTDGVRTLVRATELWADPGLTERILATLIGNALRYGGSNLEIRAIPSGPDTVIQVIDDGPEVPLSERERMFEADLRSGRSPTQPASIGLSLTVARQLARHMEGDLEYLRDNGHNIFELRLPSEPMSITVEPTTERVGTPV